MFLFVFPYWKLYWSRFQWPLSPYGYLFITATLFWPLGKTGHVAVQRPYIFFKKKKKTR